MLEIEIKTKSTKKPEDLYNDFLNFQKKIAEEIKLQIKALLSENIDFQTSPFKSNLNSDDLTQDMTTEMFESQKLEFAKALRLLNAESTPEENAELSIILGKIATAGLNASERIDVESDSDNILTFEELDFLVQIAKRIMLESAEEATSIFKFLLFLDPGYATAWIGLAICLQEMGFNQVAEQTYEMALKLIPTDYQLRIYAAEFFILIEKYERAKEILVQTKNEIIEQNTIESFSCSYKTINEILKYLGG